MSTLLLSSQLQLGVVTAKLVSRISWPVNGEFDRIRFVFCGIALCYILHVFLQGPPDSNPGGSDDISQYFHPSMLEDPWAGLTPLPLPESNFKT